MQHENSNECPNEDPSPSSRMPVPLAAVPPKDEPEIEYVTGDSQPDVAREAHQAHTESGQKTSIHARFLDTVGLSDDDRRHLLDQRCLSPAFITGRFASGTAERVQQALQQLLVSGCTDTELCQAHLIDEYGRPQGYLIDGRILIGYLDKAGDVFQVRAHQMGPANVPLEIYGCECLAKRPKRLVLCEGEFKAAALLSRGVAALAVPGISSFIGENCERLLKRLRDAGVKTMRVCFDNEDKVTPTLPPGEKNTRYKPERHNRYDTQRCAIVMARRLTGDGIPTTIAWLPDEWRDATGKVDVDSAFKDGHTLDEIKGVLDDAVEADAFLAAQTEEAQQVIRQHLCEGAPRFTSKGWKLREGDIDILVEHSDTKRVAVVLSLNYRPVFRDRFDVSSANARASFVKQVQKKNLRLDSAVVERMLEALALVVKSDGNGPIVPDDGDVVSIGSKTAIVRPDGIYIVEREGERQVSNFSLIFTEDQTINDGVEETRLLRGEIRVEGNVLPFTMNGSVLGTPIEFGKGVFASAGTSANFFGPGSEAIVRQVALASSQATRTRNELTVGWDRDGRYRTPTGCFDATGPVKVEGIDINLKGQRVAEHLGMEWIEDDEMRDLARHLHDDFLQQHAHAVLLPLLGHTFLAPLFSRLKIQGYPALMLRGPSGCGKTTLAREAQSFFGAGFAHEHSVETWLSTPNAIQRTGYFFRDCLYVVDDWKLGNLRDPASASGVLQAYADGTARQRLMRDARRSSSSYPIRGALLLTGEDAPSDQTSVAARVLIVEVPGGPNIDIGDRCLQRCHEYNGFMARYVSWLAKITDDHITQRGPQIHRRLFDGILTDTPNRSRIVSNLALNALGFELFVEFLICTGVIDDERERALVAEYDAIALNLFETNAALVGEQRAIDIFVNTLRDRLAAGECVLADRPGERPERGGRVVGFECEGEFVVLITSEAHAAVEEHLRRQGRSIGMSYKTLIKDLHDQGLLVPAGQVDHDQRRPRVWQMRRTVLGLGKNPFDARLDAVPLTRITRIPS